MTTIDQAIAAVFDHPQHTRTGNCFYGKLAEISACTKHRAARGDCHDCPLCPACEPDLERVASGQIEKALS